MAAGELIRDYFSQDVVMTWDGIPIQAYADTFVTVTYAEDHIVGTETPDAFGAYSKLPANQGTIEVTLQQNSPTHKLLTAVLQSQKTGDIQRGTFLIVDPSGVGLYTGVNAAIMTAPAVTYGKTHEDGLRTWTFHSAQLKILG